MWKIAGVVLYLKLPLPGRVTPARNNMLIESLPEVLTPQLAGENGTLEPRRTWTVKKPNLLNDFSPGHRNARWFRWEDGRGLAMLHAPWCAWSMGRREKFTYMNGLNFMVNVCLVNIMYPEDQLYGIFTIIYLYTNIPYKSTIHVSKYTLNRWYGMKKKVVLVQLHIGFPKKKKKNHNASIQRSLKPLSQLFSFWVNKNKSPTPFCCCSNCNSWVSIASTTPTLLRWISSSTPQKQGQPSMITFSGCKKLKYTL